MSAMTLRKTIIIRSNPKTVWSYLTEPEKLATWFHGPQTAIEADGKYDLANDEGVCFMRLKIRDFQPYERLEYEFELPKHFPDMKSIVLWEISEIPGGTKVDLTHSEFSEIAASFDAISNLDAGWDRHFATLRSQFEAD